MTVRALGWLGVRTPAADAMVTLYRDVLGLEIILERPGATWFRLPDGTEVHVYGPDDEDHRFFGAGPVVGLAVDSFRAAHAALAGAGVPFLYAEPQRADGRAWQHFRAPDGNVYEIIGPDDLGSDGDGLSREADVDLQLSAQAGPACTVVKVAGELDMDTRAGLDDCLQEVVDGGAGQVVLDFTELTFMDSSGLGLLVTWMKTLGGRGGRLCLAGVQPVVQTLLTISAVDRVIDVYDTVEAAEADMPPAAS